jgi:hypothetical protein
MEAHSIGSARYPAGLDQAASQDAPHQPARKGTQVKDRNTVRLLGAATALICLSALGAGGAASASPQARGVTKTVKIKGNVHPHFVTPDHVQQGESLEVVNLTDPNEIGPHTFSLVTKSQLPTTKGKIKRCAHLKLICKDIANAHEVDPGTGEVGEPIVEEGEPGWDQRFDGKTPGDSFYTETEDETYSRVVSADPGKLWFMCIVHPDMQDKIVVDPPLKR